MSDSTANRKPRHPIHSDVTAQLQSLFATRASRWLTATMLFALPTAYLHYVEWWPITSSVAVGLGVLIALPTTVFGVVGIVTGWPLILKELHEQSSRRRTWIMRVVYAVLVFMAGTAFSYGIFASGIDSQFYILGIGEELFAVFVGLQFAGIYLFLPAMTCGLITSEKERDTLSLLFLTRLGPWGILFGKFFSRLLPMFLLMGMSLPLMAFAYSLGGFESALVWAALWVLTATILQVGSLGLACSTFFRTTTGSFVATYLLGLAMLFGPPIANAFGRPLNVFATWWQEWTGFGDFLGFDEWSIDAMMFAPVVLFDNGPASGSDFLLTVLRSVPILSVSVVFIAASRFFLIRRSAIASQNLLIRLFRGLDRWFVTVNRRAGNIVLSRPSSSLPAFKPIAWRETNRRALGTTRYLVRIFIVLEFAALFVCSLSTTSFDGQLDGLSLLLILLWIVSVLLIAAASTSLIAAEKSHQTLDTLLTTPLSNQEILSQKLKGLRRLMVVLAIPLLTVIGFETMLRLDLPALNQYWNDESNVAETRRVTYPLTAVATVLIYFPMVSWLCFLIGLKVKSQGKAIIASLGAIAGWCLIPLILIMPYVAIAESSGQSPSVLWTLVSPMMVVPMNEFNEYRDPVTALIITVAVYGTAALGLRIWCTTRLGALFGRIDTALLENAPVRGARHHPDA